MATGEDIMATIISQAPAAKTSQHVGNVGDRVAVHGVIRQIIGTGKAFYVIHDEDGNEFTMRCTPYQAPGKNVRSLVHVEATVLGHTEYRGVKRTELSSGTSYNVGDDHWALHK